MSYFKKKLHKAREESQIKDPVQRANFRTQRRKFSRDHLADQVTAVPGVSDRGIEARRGDTRNKGVVSHGYARVSDAEHHKQKARDYFRSIKDTQSQIKPNLPKSEMTKGESNKSRKGHETFKHPKFNDKQMKYVRSKDYVSGHEFKDMHAGHTSPDVLLDPEHHEEFLKLGRSKKSKIAKADDVFAQAKQQGQMRGAKQVASGSLIPKSKSTEYYSNQIAERQSSKQNRQKVAIQNMQAKRDKMGLGPKPKAGNQLPSFFAEHNGVIPHDHPNRKAAVDHIIGVWRKNPGEGVSLSNKYLTGNKPKRPNIYAHMKSEVLLTPSGKYKSGDSEIFGLELIKAEGELIDYVVLFKQTDGSIEKQPSFADSSRSIASSILKDYKEKIS